MSKTKIEWTNETWNPITGCTKVSQGCKYCYAERHAKRFWGDRKFTDIQLHAERLEQPLKWRKPRLVFVNSMSDLFHEDVPFDFIDKVFGVMASSPVHTFQVLTKRPKRMLQYYDTYKKNLQGRSLYFYGDDRGYPPKNVWLGVSVEDQATADERIPVLLNCPAAVRFVSYEPALGAVDFQHITGLDWVICGGESGPDARPMHPDWASLVKNQCVSSGIPFFFKQWGEWLPVGEVEGEKRKVHRFDDGTLMLRVGKKNCSRILDGRTWDEMPTGIWD